MYMVMTMLRHDGDEVTNDGVAAIGVLFNDSVFRRMRFLSELCHHMDLTEVRQQYYIAEFYGPLLVAGEVARDPVKRIQDTFSAAGNGFFVQSAAQAGLPSINGEKHSKGVLVVTRRGTFGFDYEQGDVCYSAELMYDIESISQHMPDAGKKSPEALG